MPTAPKRVTRTQSKRKIAASSQPTIAEAFAKKRAPAEPQSTDTHESSQPTDPVIEVTSSPPVTPAPVPEPELVSDIVEEEPRPTTTRVAGTKKPDGSKPAKVFPLFSRPTPSITTQLPPEDVAPTYPPSQPIYPTSSDEAVPQALEASKPPHTQSRPKKWKSAPSNNGKSDGLTAEDPIILDIPPARTKSLPTKVNFGSRAPFKLKNKKGFGSLDAPLPTRETQHVRGPQTAFESNNVDTPFERRARGPIVSTNFGEPSTPSLAGLITCPQHSPVSSNQRPTPPPLPPSEILPEYLNQHPVFKLFSDTAGLLDVNQHSADLWVKKWAPRWAFHVLGNEVEALYLRDWLQASEINSFSGSADPSAASTPASSSQPKKKPPPKRGTKRPKIRREVGSRKAKKRRRRDDDWVVHDDQVEPHPLDNYLDDSDAPLSDASVCDEFPPEAKAPATKLPPLAYFPPDISNLSNTIILCGPSGSGKTAAVFACAAELDWEVFEVYPGIGKRSGAALETLIGQVGRNHLVTKQGRRHLSPALEKDNALTRFLGVSGAKVPGEPGSVGGTSDGTDIPDIEAMEIASDDGLGVPAPPPQGDPPPIVESVQKLQAQAKQSLILLEEVDILYRDDVNFWPTVINIIRDCRRPVILTCNETDLLPLDQIPVQGIRHFVQPPAPVAATYLSAICRAEGIQPDKHFLSALQASPTADLRWCINQCQLGGSIRSFGTTHLQETTRDNWRRVLDRRAGFPQWVSPPLDESQHKALFRRLAKHTDSISYLDSSLVLRVDTDWQKRAPADEELGHKVLPAGDLTPQEFAHYHHDLEVAEETLSLTSQLFSHTSPLDTLATSPENPGGPSPEVEFALGNPRLNSVSSDHKDQMDQLATDLSVTPRSDQLLFLEYESVVREMVVADNNVEARINAAKEIEAAQYAQLGKHMRKSQRLGVGYYRYLDLEQERREWLVERAFGGRLW